MEFKRLQAAMTSDGDDEFRVRDRKVRLWAHRDTREALTTLFNGKCAYCESQLGATGLATIDHFRPRRRTVDLHGNHFPTRYWWLAQEWTNLYLACQLCNSHKANRFPTVGPRASYHHSRKKMLESLQLEKPLLLDPCNDPVEEHLLFDEKGRVGSDTRRGEITIELLALNRAPLVRERKRVALEVRHSLARLHGSLKPGEVFSHLLAPHLPHLGLRRQILRHRVRELDRSSIRPGAKRVIAEVEQKTRDVSRQQQELIVERFKEGEKRRENYSIRDTEPYYLKQSTVERIKLKNFKGLRELDLTLPTSHDDQAPWTMLLGENAIGKSSVLQAVALALVDDTYRTKLVPDSRGLVREPRCTKAQVQVWLKGRPRPIQVEFRKNLQRSSGGEPPKVLLLAYGSTRLLPRDAHLPRPGHGYARLDNLFDPFVPLESAAAWLTRLDRMTFNRVRPALRRLLGLERPDDIVRARRGRPVKVRMASATIPLNALSDGYQSVLALACDMMAVLLERWKSMEVAEGLVLIDEIGAHLHPRWKMSIVTSLRRAFPSVQFIATTHDPLCLRGLADGEVVVLRRNSKRNVVSVANLPSIRGLRVGQLLTSEHFGLSTTRDPESDVFLSRYYALLAKSKPNNTDKKKLAEMKQDLHLHTEIGETRKERMMLAAIDRHLARERRGLASVDDTKVLEQQLDQILEGSKS